MMDYSLLVGIDSEKNELTLGIIDYVRIFTWDKKLETILKSSGLMGGANRTPTVISPKLYKNRFTEAMYKYFILVPDANFKEPASGWGGGSSSSTNTIINSSISNPSSAAAVAGGNGAAAASTSGPTQQSSSGSKTQRMLGY